MSTEIKVDGRKVFKSNVAKNSQMTMPKELREELGITPKDIVFLKVVRILSPEGETKYDEKEVK